MGTSDHAPWISRTRVLDRTCSDPGHGLAKVVSVRIGSLSSAQFNAVLPTRHYICVHAGGARADNVFQRLQRSFATNSVGPS